MKYPLGKNYNIFKIKNIPMSFSIFDAHLCQFWRLLIRIFIFFSVDEFKTARGIRTSSIYSELEARGAVFGERMG